MIELDDPKWEELTGNYGGGGNAARLLLRAQGGAPLEEWYDNLYQELCHQYTVSEAAYAAAPHLVKIAAIPGAPKTELFILLGACYAYSDVPSHAHIPVGLEEEWQASARAAIPMLAAHLAEPHPEIELRYLLSCLAAFNGYLGLARAIEALEPE